MLGQGCAGTFHSLLCWISTVTFVLTVLPVQIVTSVPAKINIGADPYLLDVLKQEVRRLGRDDVNIVGLSDGKRQQMYDKIIHAHSLATHKRIHAIIGRYDTAVAMATEKLKMAYMLTASATGVQSPNVFHLVPRKADVAQAFVDIITYYEWEKIGVFYDNEFGMSLLERLITRSDVTVKAWRVSPDSRDPLREWLIQMRRLWIQKVVVFCNKHKIHTIVRMARNLAMISSPYEWAFYNTDGEYWDTFSMFEELQSNVTIVSLMTLGKAPQTSAANELAKALGRDALWAILRSAEHISRSDRGDDEHLRTAIVSHLPTVRFDGQSGHLQFDEQGLRRNISLQVSRITDDQPRTIGYWTSEMFSNSSHFTLGLQLLPNASTAFPLKGIPVAVVMILEEPFTRRKRDHEVRIGNDRFEGFAVDLLEEIAKMLDFKYNIYLVNDGKFGAKDPDTGEWNGIIGELLAGNATMSVAPLSINSDREEAVDFTKPFMTRYVTVLMKASIPESSYFEFLNPLSEKVWLCTFGAFVGVSVVLYLLERFGHTRGKKKRQHMSLRESFWFIFGSLLQGNTDDSPSTVPGRILTSSWWFFALILISSYTANLAAFLTVKKINTPINSVTDLAQQNKIKYGTVLDSGVMSFFKNTKVEHFAKMWAKMSEVDPDSMVTSTAEGYNKVSKGGYAFFWDNTVNRYRTTVDCSYMEIGPAFDAKGFGIGVPPGAAYREELSMAILRLSDTGKLFEMENKYWGSRDCPSDKAVQPEETSELQIENVAGVFFIIVGGIILATVIGLCEKFFAVIRGSLNSEKREEAESYK